MKIFKKLVPCLLLCILVWRGIAYHTDAVYIEQISNGQNIDDRAHFFNQNTKAALGERLRNIWERDHIGIYVRTDNPNLSDHEFLKYARSSRLFYSNVKILFLQNDPKFNECKIYLVTPKYGRRHMPSRVSKKLIRSFQFREGRLELEFNLALAACDEQFHNESLKKVMQDVKDALPALALIFGGIGGICYGFYLLNRKMSHREKIREKSNK